MAIFQTQKSSALLPITFLLLLLNVKVINSSILKDEIFLFSIPKFGSYQPNLIFQGDASSTASYIQLTNLTSTGEPAVDSLGRALHSTPIHIWNSETEALASFITSFSFIIDAPIVAESAEGLTFFLAPIDTQPSQEQHGGHLGIYPGNAVAVEFDTFYNEDWDKETPHIGIDVDDIESLNTTSWEYKNGEVADVIIAYYAPTKTLNAYLAYRYLGGPIHKVSLVVDLKEVLPEWVRIGFSATTGLNKQHVETHNVLSWAFLSILPNPSSTSASTSTTIDEMFKKLNSPQLPLYNALGRKAFKKNMHLSNYAMHGRMI